MGKSPINQLRTAQMITKAAQAADKEFYKDIDPYEAEGNRMEAEQQSKVLPIDDKTSYDYDYDQNPETTAKKKTQVSNGSVAQMASPLNAYVSTAGHFQRMQDNIAAAFTPTKGAKTKAEKEAEFKGETKKVSKKLKETTDTGFKDYNAKAEFDSKSGSVFGEDENNHFNRFGQ